MDRGKLRAKIIESKHIIDEGKTDSERNNQDCLYRPYHESPMSLFADDTH